MIVDRHVDFLEALRAAGLPVSLAEGIDAADALTRIGWDDREVVRAAYAATLVKRAGHRANFDAIFDLYFPRLVGEPSEERQDAHDESSSHTGPRDTGPALSDFRDQLAAALAGGDGVGQGVPDPDALRALAVDGVGRFGSLPGRSPGLSTWSAYEALKRIEPDSLIAQIMSALREQGLDEDRAQVRASRNAAQFRRLVEDEARRRVAEEKGARHVATTTVRPTPDQVAFLHARRDELDEMRRQIHPLARRLATRLAKEQHARRRGPLDFRRTVRASIATGGVPLTTHHRPRRPHRTELVVLCDISGSVANFAQFTLLLVHALREQFGTMRAFTFVDRVHEVTDQLRPGADSREVMAGLAASAAHASLWGRTSYGRAFASFEEEYADAIGPKSSLLVLGDARSNYRDLALDRLGAMAGRARHAWWLNPEHRRTWDTGDSAATAYAGVLPMVECRNLAQLAEFVHDIA